MLDTGAARIVSYDLRSTDDQVFGLGAGCEGAMDILLTRCVPDGWQPLPLEWNSPGVPAASARVAFVTASGDDAIVRWAEPPAFRRTTSRPGNALSRVDGQTSRSSSPPSRRHRVCCC